MNIWSVVVSVLLHAGASAPLWWSLWRHGSPSPFLMDTLPCTVPLEVTAVTEKSMAPIPKPKAERDELKVSDPEEDKSPPLESTLPKDTPKENLPDTEAKDQEDPAKESQEQALEKQKEEDKEQEAKAAAKREEDERKAEQKKQEQEAKAAAQKAEQKKKEQDAKAAAQKAAQKKKEQDAKAAAKKAAQKKKEAGRDRVADLLENFDKKETKQAKKSRSQMLRNVDRDLRDGGDAETPITDPDSSSEYGAEQVGPAMSISIMDRVKRALERAWRVPSNLRGQPLAVVVTVYANPDGTVNKAVIQDKEGTPNHPAYAQACQSALRAIELFKTRPLPFDPAPYHQWKVFSTRFGSQ